jgi:hypothetical protein
VNFFIPDPPSEEVKGQMLHLLDKTPEQIETEAADHNIYKFKIGRKVKFAHLGGKVEDDWEVAGYPDKKHAAEIYVKIVKNGETLYPTQVELERMQSMEEGQEDDLEKLRSFIKNPAAKVKVNDRIVSGEFRGYSTSSTTEDKVYVADENGNLLPDKVKVDDFLAWQHEKTTDALEAEAEEERIRDETEKTQELEEKLKKYAKGEIHANTELDGSGGWVPGYKVKGYLPDVNHVVITKEGADDVPVPLENFISWQEKADEEGWQKVAPFTKGMAVKLTKLQPDGSSVEADRTIEGYEEDNGKLFIILDGGNGKKTRVLFEELKKWHEKGGEPPYAEGEEKGETAGYIDEWSHLSKKQKADRAMSAWEKKAGDKFDALALKYKVPAFFAGVFTVGMLLIPPVWPLDYAAYRAKRRRELRRTEASEKEKYQQWLREQQQKREDEQKKPEQRAAA